MKKKTGGLLAVAAIALIATANIQMGESKTSLSDVLLKNVEALAGCEPYYGGSCWLTYNGSCCTGGGYGCAPCD